MEIEQSPAETGINLKGNRCQKVLESAIYIVFLVLGLITVGCVLLITV